MFSSRIQSDLRPNRITEALAARRAPVLDLTESNPTRAGLEYPADLVSALADSRSLLYEPMPAGLPSAREAVAALYGVPPIRVLLSASSSESYSWLFKLLADPGDEVLAPRPSYPLFEFLATLEAVRVVSYPLAYHGAWSLDVHEIERRLTPQSRAVVIVNPNNPTGSFLKRDECRELVDLCAARGLAIISDEVFSDYAFRPDPRRTATLASVDGALAFSLGGLSKMAGLPQMKLGWMVVSGPEALQAQALERLELIADTYLSVGTPVQHAAPRLIAAGQAVSRQIAARTDRNLALVRGSGCEVLDVEGGWYAVLRVPRTRSEEEWTLLLLERGVLVQPGYFYDFESEAYLVVSLLTKPDVFEDGMRRIVTECERS